MIRIRNARLILEDRIMDDVCLYYSENGIEAITSDFLPFDKEIDANGLYLAPGLIDIHSHGGGDADFMDGTPEAFLQAARLHTCHGTTTIVPTATSGTAEETAAMCSVFEEAVRRNDSGADMPGLHLEGPYFAMSQRGAQDPRYVRSPIHYGTEGYFHAPKVHRYNLFKSVHFLGS